MPKSRILQSILPLPLLLWTSAAVAQQAKPAGKLAIEGHSGRAPVMQIDGKSYVEIDALARLVKGSVSFRDNLTTLTIPSQPGASSDTGSTSDPAQKPGFSKGFLRAGIEQMTAIREWRIAIVNAVQNQFPLSEEWVSKYRRDADSKLALASAAVVTDSDRDGYQLLNNEFGNMQKLSSKYVDLRKNLTYTSEDAVANDPLDAQILECARGLSALAATGQFTPVPACE